VRNTSAGLLLLLAWAAQMSARAADTIVTEQMCSGMFMMSLQWTSNQGVRHPLLALFDTGASVTLIDPDSIERISGQQLKIGTRAVMQNVTVAGLEFTEFSPRLRELDHLGQALGRSFDVLLPFQAFAGYLLTLDYELRQIRVSRGSLPRPDRQQVFSAKGPDSRPWLRTRVGARQRPLLLDSGSNGTISVHPHRSIRFSGETAKIRLSQGLGDLEHNEVGRYDGTMRFGPLDFVEPFIGLSNDTELVGYDVLKHFVLTFDQNKRRVRMQPNSASPVRMHPRMGTGALLRARADLLEVAHIIPGSPAARAGMRPGDLVTHVNGVPVKRRGCRDMQPRSGFDAYTIRRQSSERTLSLEHAVLLP